MHHFRSLSGGRAALIAAGALALVSLACLGSAATPTAVPPTPVPPTAVPPTAAPPPEQPSEPSTGGTNLDVVNQSGETICYLYIAPASQDNWGQDQLGSQNVIAAGDTFTVTDIPPDTYDLKTEDCDRNVISWNYGVNVDGSGDLTLTVGGSADQLLVDNTSSVDICRVFVSPTTEANWTRPQVDQDTPIPAGTSRTIAVVAGSWDLRVDPCGGGDSIERLGENLGSGTFTWTITD